MCDALAEFMFSLSLNHPADDLIVTLYTSFKNDDDFLRKLIHVSFKTLRTVLSLNLGSTAIHLPTAADQAWFHLILGSLKYRMLTSTCQEFLSIGPNLDKLLHMLFYLQNLVTYEHMLLEVSPQPKNQLLARLTSEVVKQMYEYNQVKQFFDPSRLQMCKLNTFLYESVSSGVDQLEEAAFSRLYSLVCLFPVSFPFTSRLILFYKALPSSTATPVYARIRREFLIEDARRLIEVMLKNGNPTSKIKIGFVDEFGQVEDGHDDGGLFKEFLVQVLHRVVSTHQLLDPNYGLFMPSRGDELVPNPASLEYVGPTAPEEYFLVGFLLARAIREKILLSNQFSPLFVRNLVGRRNGLNQLARFDEEVYSQICKTKQMKQVENVARADAAVPDVFGARRVRQGSRAGAGRPEPRSDRPEQARVHPPLCRLQSSQTVRILRAAPARRLQPRLLERAAAGLRRRRTSTRAQRRPRRN